MAEKGGVKRVVGVELFKENAEIARSKIDRDLLIPVEIVVSDVSEADLTEGTVYYMYNPFGKETIRKVLDGIRKSLVAHPRKVRIIYYNPLWESVLDHTPWLASERPPLRTWVSR
jgi:predicted RNA methylase